MRGIAGIAVIVMLGAAALWWGTDGLAAFTAESARRLEVARNPRPLPAVALENQSGALTSFEAMAGKIVLLDFVYTRCPMICTTLGSAFERLRTQIAEAGLDQRITLVTVSFDPEHDGPEQLSEYADRYGGADEIWSFVRAPSLYATQTLLRTAEVTVVPDGEGGFVHNAAIHVVDADGRLVRIVDIGAVDEALAVARGLM